MPGRLTSSSWAFCFLLAVTTSGLGCGAKTGLRVEEDAASAPAFDAGVDAGLDAGTDAGFDAGLDASVCVPGNIRLEESTVEVVFVIDRSGSMLAAFDGLPPVGTELSRWETLESAMREALGVFDDRIGVGAKFFPTRSDRTVEDGCAVSPSLDVGVGPGRAAGIIGQFSRWNPSGGTPVAAATQTALDALTVNDDPNSARFIVIATDGAPTCSADPAGEILSVVTSAHEELGIDVFVVGIASTGPEVEFLDELALRGGRARPPTEERRFYDARDPALLEALLGDITSDLARCVFAVPFPPGDDDEVEVTVQGALVPRDEARQSGWDWTSDRRTQLSLFGDACTAAADGAAVRAIITCGSL